MLGSMRNRDCISYPGVGTFVLIRPAQTFYERIKLGTGLLQDDCRLYRRPTSRTQGRSNLALEIRPLVQQELELVERHLKHDWGNPQKHRVRLERQLRDELVYLIQVDPIIRTAVSLK